MHSDFEEIKKLEKIFGIKIQNQNLFEKALTHSSYTKENNINSIENYERLEFLGDAVLKLCVSSILYKNFPEYLEGNLTKIRSIIVSDNTLAEISKQLGISKLIIMSKKEEKMGGRERKSILACAFEAVLGAYYLQGNFTEISTFLEKSFKKLIKEVDSNFEKYNAKAVLQEYTQSQSKETPVYEIMEEIGPQHNKIFVVKVSYKNKVLASGQGKTKREAEQACAYEACVKLGVIE